MQFERKDIVVLIISVVFAVAGLMVDDIEMVAALLMTAAILGCYVVWAHPGKRRSFRLGICALIWLVAFGCFARMYDRYQEKELGRNEGVLTPSAELSPPTPDGCRVPPGDLAVFFGDTVSWTGASPYNIVSIHGDPVLTLERTDNPSGGFKIKTLKLFDDRDDAIAHIDEDVFWVRSDIRKKRPDSHTLIIYDHLDREVLNIRFLNKTTVYILGTFRYPGGFAVDISPHVLRMPFGSMVVGGCLGGNGAGAFGFG